MSDAAPTDYPSHALLHQRRRLAASPSARRYGVVTQSA